MTARVVRADDEALEPTADGRATGLGMVPVVGSTGVLVLMMSAASVEGLRRVAQAWTGPVLLVGSAEEAREIIGTDSAEPSAREAPRPELAAVVAEDVPAAGPGAGALELDEDRQVVRHAGEEAPLTPLEFGLLTALLDRPGRVRRFEQLTEEVWGTPHIGDAAPVHSVVKRLRRKLELLRAPVQLQAVRGIGFRLAERPTLSVVDSS
jgi:DNA-binding winged helix-turn-helix (wHTH) protein